MRKFISHTFTDCLLNIQKNIPKVTLESSTFCKFVEGIYEKKGSNPQKNCNKRFFKGFWSYWTLRMAEKSPKKSRFRKVVFQDGGQNGRHNPKNGSKSFIFPYKVVILASKPMFYGSRNPFQSK